MKYLFQRLLYMVASCTENQLIRKIEFLKAENEMLRQRVPQKRVFLKSNEKARLVQLGQAVGSGLGELITIVTYRTFQRCGMFTKDFDATLQQAGLKVRRVGPRAPNMNAFVERWIQSVQHECLDHFLAFGEDHFNYLISEYVRYYHEERPHQSKDNLPLSRDRPPSEVLDPSEIEIVCHTRLGGLLRHYERSAA